MKFLNSNFFSSFPRILTQQGPLLNTIINCDYNVSCKIRRKLKPGQLKPYLNKQWDGGQKYYGFTYYPRFLDQKDPEWKPSILFMVKRVKPYKGLPFWEKRLLRNLRIEQNNGEIAIIINSSQNNSMLWKIKHLVEITPIVFPDGIPKEEDVPYCELLPNGELRIRKTPVIDLDSLQSTETFQRSVDTIDKETLKAYSRRQWLQPFNPINKW